MAALVLHSTGATVPLQNVSVVMVDSGAGDIWGLNRKFAVVVHKGLGRSETVLYVRVPNKEKVVDTLVAELNLLGNKGNQVKSNRIVSSSSIFTEREHKATPESLYTTTPTSSRELL